MSCPHHSGGDDASSTASRRRDRGIDRRSFLKSAVAIGGTSALSAVLGVDDVSASADLPYPTGDPAERPAQQHLWSPVGRTDQFGNPAPPSHQVVLLLDYVGDDLADDRETVEAAFRQLERAFAYDQREGLLFNVGYSPAYFKRHGQGTPDEVDLREPRPVSPFMNPTLNRQDVFVQLASDEAAIVLAAEEALSGTLETVNGVAVDASLDGVFAVDERRSVFVGAPLPAENIDVDAIEDDAPLSMGFDSAFADSIPPEDQVTIDDGPWAGATIAQVSKLRLELEEWYERDIDEQVAEMWSPRFDPEDVGDFGEALGQGSGITPADADGVEDDVEQYGVAGHSAKVARARDEAFEPKILRRDGDITLDGGDGGLSFVGLVAAISDWLEVAEAMYDTELDGQLREHDGRNAGDEAADDRGRQHGEDGGGQPADHHPRSGIAAQMDVRARGNFLIPPRSLRSLPPSRP